MNDLETKSPAPDANAGDSSDYVERQLNLLRLGLIVLSVTFAVFLWRQVHYSRQDLQAIKQQHAFMTQNFNQEKPVSDAFIARLVEFGRTHTNFLPVLQKYQITSAPPTPAAAAAVAPAGVKPASKPATTPAPAPKK